MNPQGETLADYYWEVQKLRLEAGTTSGSARALRDLGIIYLRIGQYEEAQAALTRGLAQERADPKLWFYAGLAEEVLDRPSAALAIYERSPFLSTSSLHSRATKGRIAWLQEAMMRAAFETAMTRGTLPPSDSLPPLTYAVFPLACSSASPAYTALGSGLGALLSHDLNQIRNVSAVDAERVRAALTVASASGAPDVRMVARTLQAGKVIEGTCTLAADNTLAVNLVLHDFAEGQTFTLEDAAPLDQIFPLEDRLIDQIIDVTRLWVPNRAHRMPAPSSEALIAYSQGLEHEQAGRLAQSLQAYTQSVAVYPRFTPASIRQEVVRDKALAESAAPEDLVALLIRLERATGAHVLPARLQKLDNTINAGIMPGQDNRKLPPGTVGELPSPPRPTGQ